jgi:hypothetical protein
MPDGVEAGDRFRACALRLGGGVACSFQQNRARDDFSSRRVSGSRGPIRGLAADLDRIVDLGGRGGGGLKGPNGRFLKSRTSIKARTPKI